MLAIKQKEVTVQTFSSFSTDSMGDQTIDCAFYKEFIKDNLFHSSSITHTLVKEMDAGKPTKPFAVYVLLVNTTHIQYSVQRRYSCFRRLYKKIAKKASLKSEFPAKTFWSSSISDCVVNKRKQSLNNFINQLMALESEQCFVDFLDFLGVRAKYSQQNILLQFQKQNKNRTDQEHVFDLLEKLAQQADFSSVFKELEKCIFEDRIRLSSEAIRQLFMGLGSRKGLLKFCLCDQSQGLICLRALQLANRLMNFQQNRDAELYVRNFVNCPHKTLKILPELLKSCQVKQSYFQLLNTYLTRNCDLDTEQLLNFFFSQNFQEKQDYIFWSKLRCSTSINAELYEEKLALSHTHLIDQKVSWLLNQTQSETSEWRTLFEKVGDNYLFKSQQCRKGIVKYTYFSNSDQEKLKQMFVNTMSWRNNVTISKTNPYAKTLTVHMGLGNPKVFKFSLATKKLGKETVFIRKPLSTDSTDFSDTFYQLVRITTPKEGHWTSSVEIWQYYESAAVREWIQQESGGKQEILSGSLRNEQ